MLENTKFREAQENRMLIKEFDAKTMEKMVEFIHSDEIKDFEGKEAELYKISDKYQIKSLKVG